MKICNVFGITPTNTYVSAGSDYYVPVLDTEEKIHEAFEAFQKSYNISENELKEIINEFENQLPKNLVNHYADCVHLYLALYSMYLEPCKKNANEGVAYFITEYLIYDEKKDRVGIKMDLNDTLFINSGIKVALDTVLSDQYGPNKEHEVNIFRMLGIGVAGLYVNKSGKGNAGWDVRACLVDEDYAGYVHLSMAYTKDVERENGKNYIYCGDKLTQMMLIPVFHTNYENVTQEEYNKIMENSERGASGFGSSDIKH